MTDRRHHSDALAQLQAQFQRAILGGDTGLNVADVTTVRSSGHASGRARIAVYATAYRLRLIDALSANFPRLTQLLGREQFQRLASSYLDAHPSRHGSVRWFGHQLAEYLATCPEFQTHPDAIELAMWEWAVAAAFDAPDITPLSINALANVATADWPHLRFTLHPSVQRLVMTTNAVTLFKAMEGDQSLSPETLQTRYPASPDGPQRWLIWRDGLDTRYRPLAADEALAMVTIAEHGTFENLCDALCNCQPLEAVPARAASLLKTWIVDGLIASYSPSTNADG